MVGWVMARAVLAKCRGSKVLSSDRSPRSTQRRAPSSESIPHSRKRGQVGKAGAGEDEEREARLARPDNIAISGGMEALSVESPTHCTLSE